MHLRASSGAWALVTAGRFPSLGGWSAVNREDIDALIDRVVAAQHAAAQRGKLSVWTIHAHPLDWPDGYVARRFESRAGAYVATASELRCGDLDTLRNVLEGAGLASMTPAMEDDPDIVERWM
jgi:hypothetical protein